MMVKNERFGYLVGWFVGWLVALPYLTGGFLCLGRLVLISPLRKGTLNPNTNKQVNKQDGQAI